MGIDYRSSGVDVEAGYKAVDMIRRYAKETFTSKVLSDIGGFGGFFSISEAKDMDDPVLVSGTDGVGTKLKLAFVLDKHATVGIDLVAMCVNDIICSGARPLFFLDYIASAKTVPHKIAAIVKGITDGCEMAGVALVGGETAEMPGFYAAGEYDLAGFAVGIVDRKHIIDGRTIKSGDAIIGLGSNGLHSNGFSLVRGIIRPNVNNLSEFIKQLDRTLGEELLAPTRIYVKTILELTKTLRPKGICNITGGGIIENIPRMLPDGLKAVIDENAWMVSPIFDLLQRAGELDRLSMYNAFNMGIGMALVTNRADAERTVDLLRELGESAYIIGEVQRDSGGPDSSRIEICLK